MIRSFRDLWENLFHDKNQEGPDLFEYANQEKNDPPQNQNEINQNNSNKKKYRIAIGALAALYPLIFAAGYFTHQAGSVCDELQEALGMVPEIGVSEESSLVPDLPPGAGQYLGQYSAEVSGHKAILYIYQLKTGGIGGAIRFTEWGKREMEYLKAVRVVNHRLSFIRSCKGPECVRIGSPSNIYQVYSGEIDPSGNVIKGNYTGGQSASSWRAVRIR